MPILGEGERDLEGARN